MLQFPSLRITIVNLNNLSIASPLNMVNILTNRPNQQRQNTIIIVRVAHGTLAITLRFQLQRQRAQPKQRILRQTHNTRRITIRRRGVRAKTVTVLTQTTNVTLLITQTKLPTGTTRHPTLIFKGHIPFIPQNIPRLIRRAVFQQHRPHRRYQVRTNTFTHFERRTFIHSGLTIRHQRARQPIRPRRTSTRNTTTNVTRVHPSFIGNSHRFVHDNTINQLNVSRTPMRLTKFTQRRVASRPVAQFTIATWLLHDIRTTTRTPTALNGIRGRLRTLRQRPIRPQLHPIGPGVPGPTRQIHRVLTNHVHKVSDHLAKNSHQIQFNPFTVPVVDHERNNTNRHRAHRRPSSEGHRYPAYIDRRTNFVRTEAFGHEAGLDT